MYIFGAQIESEGPGMVWSKAHAPRGLDKSWTFLVYITERIYKNLNIKTEIDSSSSNLNVEIQS